MMSKTIDNDYAALVLSEILMEQELINKDTFEAIKEKVQSEKSHISQNQEEKV